MKFYPGYLKLLEEGKLEEKIDQAVQVLENCTLCPRECRVNRLKDQRGACRSGRELRISSVGPHFGEERELVGIGGSGTIFLANCNLNCVFCQNYEISQHGEGWTVDTDQAADSMLYLQEIGCHNINWVTPTHYVPQLLEAILTAARRGLNIPIVYNCGGYESLETLKLLDGVVDIYMPDAKYMDGDIAFRLSGVREYPEHMTAALKEMYRQVGDLVLDERGIAFRGLLIRHLVLPNNLAGTDRLFEFLFNEFGEKVSVNVMAQYRPSYKALDYEEISRGLKMSEYDRAVELARKYGFRLL